MRWSKRGREVLHAGEALGKIAQKKRPLEWAKDRKEKDFFPFRDGKKKKKKRRIGN